MFLSPSAIFRFIQCPEKFWLSQECKPLPLKTEAMQFGYDLHEIIAEYYRTLMKSNSITPAELEAKLIVSAKKHGISEQLYSKYRWHFRNFIKFEFERISWHVDIKPVAVEKEFRKKPFYGIIDAIFRKDNDYVIVDWKSSSYYGNLSDFYKIQGYIYRYVTGIDEMVFYFLRNGQYRKIIADDCKDAVHIIRSVLSDIKQGARYRNEGSHCDFCEYQIACLYGKSLRWLDDTYWIKKAIKRT